MEKKFRLRKSKDFLQFKSGRKTYSDHFLRILFRFNDADNSRVGFSIGKNVGNAVVRNKLKRRLREIVQLSDLLSNIRGDLLIIAKPNSSNASFDDIKNSLINLVKRI
ncbi:MAG: ribonuclease P protein component [SAR202 cluster bacterium]|nr:ribonuclease P protein component [SAR202 cluster bacterium]|tara:strand:+ start:34966 stop:35289 length:324 start_codon:yes stop_codon:yes gene_type:complete